MAYIDQLIDMIDEIERDIQVNECLDALVGVNMPNPLTGLNKMS